MAKIRLRMGSCEVEISSSDFSIDNRTMASVIEGVAKSLRCVAPQALILAAPGPASANPGGRIVQDAGGTRPLPPATAAASTDMAAPRLMAAGPTSGMQAPASQATGCPDLFSALDCLEEAEVFEPEFDEPRRVSPPEVAGRLKALVAGGFFEMPRTVTEAVAEMAERGWLAGPLDVSKALARMAMGKEMRRESRGYMTCYCSPPPVIAAAGSDSAAGGAATAAACPPAPVLS